MNKITPNNKSLKDNILETLFENKLSNFWLMFFGLFVAGMDFLLTLSPAFGLKLALYGFLFLVFDVCDIYVMRLIRYVIAYVKAKQEEKKKESLSSSES